MNERNCCGHNVLSGVECGVINCRYNENGSKCTADCIKVKNESAMKQAETFCGTFSARKMSS